MAYIQPATVLDSLLLEASEHLTGTEAYQAEVQEGSPRRLRGVEEWGSLGDAWGAPGGQIHCQGLDAMDGSAAPV